MSEDKDSIESKRKLLDAIVSKPTTFKVDIIDGTMLPKKLKFEDDKVSFTFKPPSLFTMAQAAKHLVGLPEDMFVGAFTLEKALPHINVMVKTLCVMAHAQDSDYPHWHEEFILKNTTSEELFRMFSEVALKLKTDFFLSSIHIANQNPLTIKMPKNNS